VFQLRPDNLEMSASRGIAFAFSARRSTELTAAPRFIATLTGRA
jgi:hypothetical protein